MKTKGNIDISIALLRPLLCLGVVCCHFWSSAPSYAWHFVLPCCAPLFFLISFYLFAERYTCVDGLLVRKRFFRLYFPMVFWALFYYLVINLSHLLIKTESVVSLKALFIQSITGHCYDEPMWFQFDLIVVTLLFFFFAVVCRNKLRIILWFFAGFTLFAFCLQYTGLNHRVFSPLDYSFRYPLGRICEMLPYAFAGMSLSFADKMKKWGRAFIVVSMFLASYVLYIFHDNPPGFGYQGIRFLLLSVAFFLGIKLLDFNWIPNGIKKVILTLSNYTLGIYCAHLLIEKGLRHLFSHISWESLCGSLLYCIIIYICCFFLFFFIDKLIRNKYLKMAFQ